MKSRINSTLKSGLLLAGLSTALLVLAGGCPEQNASTSDIRYVNMATSLYMEPSEAVFDGISSGYINRAQVSSYMTHASKPAPLVIRNKDAQTVFSNDNFDVSDNSISNIIAVGNEGSVEVVEVAVPRDEPAPGAHEVVLHFVHGMQGQYPVDIYLVPTETAPTGTPEVSGLAYRGVFRLPVAIIPDMQPQPKAENSIFDIVVCSQGTTSEFGRITVSPRIGEHSIVMVTPVINFPGTRTYECQIRLVPLIQVID